MRIKNSELRLFFYFSCRLCVCVSSKIDFVCQIFRSLQIKMICTQVLISYLLCPWNANTCEPQLFSSKYLLKFILDFLQMSRKRVIVFRVFAVIRSEGETKTAADRVLGLRMRPIRRCKSRVFALRCVLASAGCCLPMMTHFIDLSAWRPRFSRKSVKKAE